MKAEDVKIGMKVKIVKNPPCLRYGHGEVGGILTAVKLLKWPDDQFTLMAEGFTKSPDGSSSGGISLRYLEPVLEPFTKSNLKTGMRVIYRNGCPRVVGGPNCLYTEDGSHSFSLRAYTEDIKKYNGLPDYDIMEVYAAPTSCEDFFNLDVRGELLFKREEPPVKTEKQLRAEKLMQQADDLKAQFEALVKQATDLAGAGE